MPQAETAVEAAIYSLGGKLFARVINPLIILFVILGITLFLWIIFRSIMDKSQGKTKSYQSLLPPLIGLTIMLSAIGITYFIGNTGNEIFQSPRGAGAVQGIDQVVQPINIR